MTSTTANRPSNRKAHRSTYLQAQSYRTNDSSSEAGHFGCNSNNSTDTGLSKSIYLFYTSDTTKRCDKIHIRPSHSRQYILTILPIIHPRNTHDSASSQYSPYPISLSATHTETTVVITAIKLYYDDGTIAVIATPTAAPQQKRRHSQMKRQLVVQTVVGVEVSYSVSTPVVSRSQCLSPQFITHPININTRDF